MLMEITNINFKFLRIYYFIFYKKFLFIFICVICFSYYVINCYKLIKFYLRNIMNLVASLLVKSLIINYQFILISVIKIFEDCLKCLFFKLKLVFAFIVYLLIAYQNHLIYTIFHQNITCLD